MSTYGTTKEWQAGYDAGLVDRDTPPDEPFTLRLQFGKDEKSQSLLRRITAIFNGTDNAENLLRRALYACNLAERFEFGYGDDSYKLAADIESYLRLTADNETQPTLTREQLITLVRYADSHLEDWRTGVEDGTYDDKEGLEELVAAIAAGYAAIGKP